MTDKKTPTAPLHSLIEGKIVDWDLSVDSVGEIIASHGDEVLKFPAGLDRTDLLVLFEQHNQANENIVALTPEEMEGDSKAVAASNELLDSLE